MNTLMQRFSKNGLSHFCTAVSKYILIHAYEKCEGALINALVTIVNVTGHGK